MPSYLHYSDPRLGLPVAGALVSDPRVSQIVKVMTDQMRGTDCRVLAAPMIGFGIKAIVLMNDGTGVELLNPVLVDMGNFRFNPARRNPVLKGLARPAWAPRRIVVRAQRHDGSFNDVALEGSIAEEFALCMEFIEGRNPCTGLSSFELSVLNDAAQGLESSAVRQLHDAIFNLAQPPDLPEGQAPSYPGLLWSATCELAYFDAPPAGGDTGEEQSLSPSQDNGLKLDFARPLLCRTDVNFAQAIALAFVKPETTVLLRSPRVPLFPAIATILRPDLTFQVVEENHQRADLLNRLAVPALSKLRVRIGTLDETAQDQQPRTVGAVMLDPFVKPTKTSEARDFEAAMRRISRILASDGFMFQPVLDDPATTEFTKRVYSKIFPAVLTLQAGKEVVVIGARTGARLTAVQQSIWAIMQRHSDIVPFLPEHFTITAISKDVPEDKRDA